MHEYPATMSIIKTAEQYAKSNGAAEVCKINLVVGDYSGFVPESITMYFEEIAKGTLCSGAVLNIERVRPKLKCTGCNLLFDRKPFSFNCPDCGGDGLPTDIGYEFYIKSIEVR